MSYKKQVRTVQTMPSSEELETAGIRELTVEELFKVNGGRNVKDDPARDRISQVRRSSSRSSGSSERKYSGSSGSSSSSYKRNSVSAASSSSYKKNSGSGESTSSKADSYTASIASGSINRPYSRSSKHPTSATSSKADSYTASIASGSINRPYSGSSKHPTSATSSKADSYTASIASGSINRPYSGSSGKNYSGSSSSSSMGNSSSSRNSVGNSYSSSDTRSYSSNSSGSSEKSYSSGSSSSSGKSYSPGSESSSDNYSGKANAYTQPEEKQQQTAQNQEQSGTDSPSTQEPSLPNTSGTAAVLQKPKPETIGEHKPKKRLTERVNEKFFQKFAKTQEYLVGTKYVYGAENPLNPKEGGVDCSGAIYYGLRTMGYILPRSNADSFLKKYTKEVERTQIMPGDLRGLKTKEGRFYHVQTLMQSYRINPSGDETNTQNNPGIVEKFDSPLPSTGVIRRLDQDKLNKYYDPGKDIISGKLSVGLLDRAYSELLQYSN